MDRYPDLAPCIVGSGTVSRHRDMLRALETLEGLTYTYSVDGRSMSEGSAALVKLMADAESATMLVNGCLFVNVASFRYLTFLTNADGTCRFELHGDGSVLELTPSDEVDPRTTGRDGPRMIDEVLDLETFVVLEEEEDDDA